ncbi:Rhodanese-like domain-containing protein [Quillaja saponaria]|uniref:Rhodanese-like domain-containing protein n=1 Tax=Quillaja saponaria TaxID=32244 RepID=A0AAD7KUK7_QUISA|nr:Rhodanese-like domain-containing protein [Quillaja saponaria]
MSLAKRPYAYSKMDMEDPEEKIHRRAQFLIYKVLEQADSRRKPSYLGFKVSKLKVKIGKRLKRLRKRMLSGISEARVVVYKQVISQLKTWKKLFGHGETIISQLPPLFIK